MASTTAASWRSSTPFITFVLCWAIFVDQFIFAIIVPVAPFTLEQRNHVPADSVQQWIAVLLCTYGAAQFIFSPIFGWIADNTPDRKLPFRIGLVAIIASTILLWLAPSIKVAVFARVVQGAADAIVWVTSLAIIADTVGQEHVGEYMGYIALAGNAGSVIGPLLGGVVFAKLGYHAVFIMALITLAGDVVLRFLMLEKRSSRSAVDESIVEMAYVRATSDTENDAIEQGGKSMLKVNVTVSAHSSCSSLPALFKPLPPRPDGQYEALSIYGDNMAYSCTSPYLELTEPTPKPLCISTSTPSRKPRQLPAVLSLLFSPRFFVALWGIFVQAAVGASFRTSLPLYLSELFSWGAIQAGLAFLPLAIPSLLGPLFGWTADRYGPRWVATIAFAAMGPLVILLRIVSQNTVHDKVVLFVLLGLIGICPEAAYTPLSADIAAVATELDDVRGRRKGASYAQASGLFNAASALGNTVGPLATSGLMDVGGWGTINLVMGVVTGVTAIPVMLLCGGRLWKR
ncbi:hypothetical protein B0A48_04139 [Cryoendolithus antarcticus]|uniref:Major facilitator superfamily (MFS) profile domain-containing protein n=1 Tax=Cryoendolithus antarcticus TaxID=1507870 RepID=A0A1V8THW6_9PEZI|nr:hypothetical protein B0A48_04139 [Cryoendolithus antarcticus]